VSLPSGDEVPHIFTRKSRVQPREFLISGAKRLLQQYRPVADARVAGTSVRNWIKFRRQSQARLTVVGDATVVRISEESCRHRGHGSSSARDPERPLRTVRARVSFAPRAPMVHHRPGRRPQVADEPLCRNALHGDVGGIRVPVAYLGPDQPQSERRGPSDPQPDLGQPVVHFKQPRVFGPIDPPRGRCRSLL